MGQSLYITFKLPHVRPAQLFRDGVHQIWEEMVRIQHNLGSHQNRM